MQEKHNSGAVSKILQVKAIVVDSARDAELQMYMKQLQGYLAFCW